MSDGEVIKLEKVFYVQITFFKRVSRSVTYNTVLCLLVTLKDACVLYICDIMKAHK